MNEHEVESKYASKLNVVGLIDWKHGYRKVNSYGLHFWYVRGTSTFVAVAREYPVGIFSGNIVFPWFGKNRKGDDALIKSLFTSLTSVRFHDDGSNYASIENVSLEEFESAIDKIFILPKMMEEL